MNRAHIQEAMRNPKVKSMTYLRMGDSYAGQAKWSDAAAAYRKSLEVTPDLPEASEELAEAEKLLRDRVPSR